jgi:hypothetical protein
METERNKNKVGCYNIAESFEQLFSEYKRRVLLSRIFSVLSFLLFAVAIVFVSLFVQLSCVLLFFGFILNRVSKKHLLIANLAEHFILGEL